MLKTFPLDRATRGCTVEWGGLASVVDYKGRKRPTAEPDGWYLDLEGSETYDRSYSKFQQDLNHGLVASRALMQAYIDRIRQILASTESRDGPNIAKPRARSAHEQEIYPYPEDPLRQESSDLQQSLRQETSKIEMLKIQ